MATYPTFLFAIISAQGNNYDIYYIRLKKNARRILKLKMTDQKRKSICAPIQIYRNKVKFNI